MEVNSLQSYQTEIIEDVDEVEEPQGKSPRAKILSFILDITETLVLSALLFVGINAISARIRVDGHSMQPTLQNGEFVIVNKLAYKIGQPKIGDVIVFHYPKDPEQEYIKRVIGLPEDEVLVQNGEVFVNGVQLNEPYIAASPNYNGKWVVPEENVFVLGDNRNNSSDSHNWGMVPLDYIVGKALFIYWPPEEWGVIKHPKLTFLPE